jgi:hypothetical protein
VAREVDFRDTRAMRTLPRLALAPAFALSAGCFVIAEARTARQAELALDYVKVYGEALRHAKAFETAPAAATTQSVSEAIVAAEQCQRVLVGHLDESINDAGSMLYEDPATEGFVYGGLHVPLATAYGHCRELQRRLLAREVRACPVTRGAFVERFLYGRSTGRELQLTAWSPGVCELGSTSTVDPASALSDAEVAKVRAACEGAVALRVFAQGSLVKIDPTTHDRRTPVRCEQAPITVRGAAIPAVSDLPPFDAKCPDCAAWDRAAAAGTAKPTLGEAFARTSTPRAMQAD